MPKIPPQIQIPAICSNKKCQAVGFTPFGLGGDEGATFRNFQCSPVVCPVCGSPGIVPKADYVITKTSAIITPQTKADRELLNRVQHLMRAVIAGEISPEDLEKEVSGKSPWLTALMKAMPANREEKIKYLTLLFAAISSIAAAYSAMKHSQPPQIVLPREVIEAIQSSQTHRDTRIDSRDETRRERRERERQLDRWKKGRKK